MDIEETIAEIESNWEAVREAEEDMPEGLCVGKVAVFSVADGKAAYEVVEIGEKISVVEYRDDLVLDRYQSSAVDYETGEILTSVLRRQIEREENMREVFGS